MTERRCIAMGRGAKERPHFYFADIDTKDLHWDFLTAAEGALVIESRRGFHVISSTPITNEAILKVADPLCPGNAVRFYPHDDLRLLKAAKSLCVKVAKIYESVFNGMTVCMTYESCDQPLKFGIYIAEKDGIKQTGEQRLTK